jgi:hypothetical protein
MQSGPVVLQGDTQSLLLSQQRLRQLPPHTHRPGSWTKPPYSIYNLRRLPIHWGKRGAILCISILPLGVPAAQRLGNRHIDLSPILTLQLAGQLFPLCLLPLRWAETCK